MPHQGYAMTLLESDRLFTSASSLTSPTSLGVLEACISILSGVVGRF